MFSIGQRIAICRNSRRWTQKRLASEIGIPQSVLSEIENDIVSPKWETINAIATCMEVQLQHLLPLEETTIADYQKTPNTEKTDEMNSAGLQESVRFLETLLKIKDELLKAREETIELLKRQLNYS